MLTGIIYCAISPNGKKYYGKTINGLNRRKKLRENSANRNSLNYFHRALRKYGHNNFIWEIIETIEKDDKKELIDVLSQMEIYWINKDQTNNLKYGYNMTPGGDGGPFF